MCKLCTNFATFFFYTYLQQAHIPTSIMMVLEGEKKPEPKSVESVMEIETMDGDKMVLSNRCFNLWYN